MAPGYADCTVRRGGLLGQRSPDARPDGSASRLPRDVLVRDSLAVAGEVHRNACLRTLAVCAPSPGELLAMIAGLIHEDNGKHPSFSPIVLGVALIVFPHLNVLDAYARLRPFEVVDLVAIVLFFLVGSSLILGYVYRLVARGDEVAVSGLTSDAPTSDGPRSPAGRPGL